jgi:hypothetical protein
VSTSASTGISSIAEGLSSRWAASQGSPETVDAVDHMRSAGVLYSRMSNMNHRFGRSRSVGTWSLRPVRGDVHVAVNLNAGFAKTGRGKGGLSSNGLKPRSAQISRN